MEKTSLKRGDPYCEQTFELREQGPSLNLSLCGAIDKVWHLVLKKETEIKFQLFNEYKN